MKAISLHQPWASLIATGQKTIETRRWATQHRGLILICAAKKSYPGCKKHLLGKALAVAYIDHVRPMTKADEPAACCGLYEDAYAWILKDIRPIIPFRVTGRQRIFNVNKELSDLTFITQDMAETP